MQTVHDDDHGRRSWGRWEGCIPQPLKKCGGIYLPSSRPTTG